MNEEIRPEILYSDPVREIMGKPPRKILQYGTTLIFSVFFLFLILAWIIKYPDVIRAQVEITTENPPVPVTAKISGRIKNLYVRDREVVPPGKLLAVIETAASITDIDNLKRLVDTIKHPELLPINLTLGFTRLGEIQGHWAAFQKNLSDYQTFIKNDYYGYKIISTTEEIRSLIQYIDRIQVKEKLFIENQKLEEKKFKRDSLLYVQNVFSESDIENSHQALIRNKIDLQQVRLDHSTKQIELASKNQLLQDYRIMGQAEKDKLLSVLNESFLNLFRGWMMRGLPVPAQDPFAIGTEG
jgi:HlyD family secretion protein